MTKKNGNRTFDIVRTVTIQGNHLKLELADDG